MLSEQAFLSLTVVLLDNEGHEALISSKRLLKCIIFLVDKKDYIL